MNKFIIFIESKIFGDDDFANSFGFTLFLTIAFVLADLFTSNDLSVSKVSRTIFTYFLPSFNILYISFILYKFDSVQNLKMMAFIFLSLGVYVAYLSKSSYISSVFVCTPIFIFYFAFMNSWILVKCKEMNKVNSQIDGILKVTA